MLKITIPPPGVPTGRFPSRMTGGGVFTGLTALLCISIPNFPLIFAA